MRIVSVVGARPQFIKAAVVSRVLRERGGVNEVMVHTGQHYDADMSRVFFDELAIPPADIDLGVGSLPHGAQTGRILERLEGALMGLAPDWVVVYGDTNSTVAGALAAVKLHIAVAHVEAGLRSFNRRMPEEINRLVTDHVADLLFAPTQTAVDNLQKEGIVGGRVALCGDVMLDAARFYAERAERQSRILDKLGLATKQYVLATVHRAENTDDPARLSLILDGLSRVARTVPVVLPLHPRTKAALARVGGRAWAHGGLQLVPPVGYLDMVKLERSARLIATDSGGVQKEGFFHGVPVVTLRNETEWVELVELGWNRLVPPTSSSVIVEAIRMAWDVDTSTLPVAHPYGDGAAGQRIAERLLERA